MRRRYHSLLRAFFRFSPPAGAAPRLTALVGAAAAGTFALAATLDVESPLPRGSVVLLFEVIEEAESEVERVLDA